MIFLKNLFVVLIFFSVCLQTTSVCPSRPLDTDTGFAALGTHTPTPLFGSEKDSLKAFLDILVEKLFASSDVVVSPKNDMQRIIDEDITMLFPATNPLIKSLFATGFEVALEVEPVDEFLKKQLALRLYEMLETDFKEHPLFVLVGGFIEGYRYKEAAKKNECFLGMCYPVATIESLSIPEEFLSLQPGDFFSWLEVVVGSSHFAYVPKKNDDPMTPRIDLNLRSMEGVSSYFAHNFKLMPERELVVENFISRIINSPAHIETVRPFLHRARGRTAPSSAQSGAAPMPSDELEMRTKLAEAVARELLKEEDSRTSRGNLSKKKGGKK